MDTFYKVSNPLKEDLTIMFKGVFYTLPSEGVLDMIPEPVAKHWESLHAFLSFEKMKSVPVSKLKEQIEEEIVKEIEPVIIDEVVDLKEEVSEEVVAETVVEKPTRKGKK